MPTNMSTSVKISLVFRVKLAKNLIIHPNWCNWCDSNGAYDYAIIRLVEDIVFSPIANAACLPSFTDPSTTDGKIMTISGWGLTERTSEDDFTATSHLNFAQATGPSFYPDFTRFYQILSRKMNGLSNGFTNFYSTNLRIFQRIIFGYRKVASSSISWLVAHQSIFRMFMKGKFDAYVL